MSERIRPIKPEVSPGLRDYYNSLRTGDNVAEVIGKGRKMRVQQLAKEAIGIREFIDEAAPASQRRHYFPGGSVAIGPNHVERRGMGNETDKQEKDDE